MAIDPSVRTVMQRVNREHPGSVILGSDIKEPLRQTITTGSLNLDAALGGGWATNHWIEIVGHESAGKTMLVLLTIAANQRLDPDWTVVWFATEDFVEVYAKMLGVDVSRVIVVNLNQLETVYQYCIDFLQTKSIDCIVIDSLPGLVPIREDDNTMSEFQPGLIAFLTGKFLRMSNPSMKRSLTEPERPCTGFIINQWREKIGVMHGDPRTTPGGKGKNFWFFQRVDVQRAAFIENTKKKAVGQTIRVKNIKNKHAPPRRDGEIDVYFADYRAFKAGDVDIVKDIVSADRRRHCLRGCRSPQQHEVHVRRAGVARQTEVRSCCS